MRRSATIEVVVRGASQFSHSQLGENKMNRKFSLRLAALLVCAFLLLSCDNTNSGTEANSHNAEGAMLEASGDYVGAIAEYSKAISMNGSKFEYYRNRASAFYSQGNYDKALDDYEHYTTMVADDKYSKFAVSMAYLRIGQIYNIKKAFKDAVANFNKAESLGSDKDFRLYEGLGDAYAALGKSQDAVTSYQTALNKSMYLPSSDEQRIKEKIKAISG